MAGKKKQAQLTPEEKLQQALVPEAEQPYKVPANWCWTKLGSISLIKGGKRLPPGKKLNDIKTGYPYIRVTDFDSNSVDVNNIKYIDEETYKILDNYKISINDIYISIAGSIGKVGIIPEILNGAILTENAAKITNIILQNQIYLLYILCSEFCQNQMKESAIATTQSKLALFRIANIKLPLPPLAEQQRIVERIESLFAKLDETKETLQNALDGFETRKAAILHKAFTGELTANWRKQYGVSMDSWEEKRLGEVCKINPSKINTKNLSDDLEVSFFPMASLSEITGEIVGPEIRTLGKVKNDYTNFSEGDVVFAKITPCMENGKSAIIGKLINGIGYGTTEFYVLRCGEELSNKYLHHIVRSKKFRDEAKHHMTGAVGQQRVPKKYMKEYMLNLPTLDEQTEIISIIDELLAKEQQAKELAENAITKIDIIKKSILARAFRGELGTNNLADEPAAELLKRML